VLCIQVFYEEGSEETQIAAWNTKHCTRVRIRETGKAMETRKLQRMGCRGSKISYIYINLGWAERMVVRGPPGSDHHVAPPLHVPRAGSTGQWRLSVGRSYHYTDAAAHISAKEHGCHDKQPWVDNHPDTGGV